jgi:hypothetical protein
MKKILVAMCIGVFLVAGCTSKPSKGAVQKAIVKQVGTDGLDAKTKKSIEDVAGCIVDESYDDLSAKTLNKIADSKSDFADNPGANDKEKKALEKAISSCSLKYSKTNS